MPYNRAAADRLLRSGAKIFYRGNRKDWYCRMKTGIRLTAAVLISLFVISAAGCANEKSLSSETGGHTDSSQTPPAAADILKKAPLSRKMNNAH